MGSIETSSYSVQDETHLILENGILANPLHSTLLTNYPDLPSLARRITFTGSPTPCIAIPWRFAESISALKALEATLLNVLITRKYSVEPGNVTINTDHASLFFMSPLIMSVIDPETRQPEPIMANAKKYTGLFKNCDLHRMNASLHRELATNIYKTKDGRFVHVHGSMNPEPTLKGLGLGVEGEEGDDFETVVERIGKKVGEWDSSELNRAMNEEWKQAGTVAWSTEEFKESEHGKANEGVGLWEIEKVEDEGWGKGWWVEGKGVKSGVERPLAGLKVVDLTRVIAAPSISRGLAQMGASVMRITGEGVTDMSSLHPDLNWGKWNAHLNLKSEDGKQKLRALIKDADVVVEGYRPGAMDRNGFSRKDIFELVKGRDRGIIHVKENCYGWHGPWQGRSGWQQISDAVSNPEALIRVLANKDSAAAFPSSMVVRWATTKPSPRYSQILIIALVSHFWPPITSFSYSLSLSLGVAGACAVLDALMQRADKGGSYAVNVALNYYSQWLVRSVGMYPSSVWREVFERHGSPVFRHYHNMGYTIPRMLAILKEHDAKTIYNPAFFEAIESKAVGRTFVQPKAVAQWDSGVELRYNVGTRGNGVDQPYWPEDLSTEVVR